MGKSWMASLLLILLLPFSSGSRAQDAPLGVSVLAEQSEFSDALRDAVISDEAGRRIVDRPDQADVLVAVGDKAFRQGLQHDTPLLGVYVSRVVAVRAQRDGCRCAALWAGVSLASQLDVITTMMPGARRLGVVIGPDQTWSTPLLSGSDYDVSLVPLPVEGPRELASVLRDQLAQLDALLLAADGTLFDRGTAKLVLLTAYRQRRPVFGPDRSFVRAGSAASAYASGEDLIASALTMLDHYQRTNRWPASGFVASSSVTVNEHVSRTFGMLYRETDALRDALEAGR